jgi:hypothetical protein
MHGVLTLGVAAVGAVFVGLDKLAHMPPVLADAALIGNIMAGVAILEIALAGIVLRPRIPARPRITSVDEFWADVNVRGPALLVWVLCEGGGIVGAVGYRLSAMPADLAAIAVALIALVWLGPGTLEQSEP